MQYVLNDFERQTLAYLLYVMRISAKKDSDDPQDSVIINFDERLGGDEYQAMWALGLNMMKTEKDNEDCVRRTANNALAADPKPRRSVKIVPATEG